MSYLLRWKRLCLKLPPLQRKIEHSIELLRKAEKIALAYDKENGYWLAFSAGKDSQCLYHIAKLANVHFKAHMNLTSVDPPEVIRFLKQQYPDVERIKPSRSIFQSAIHRKCLPSKFVRWCCAEFKEGAGRVTLIGIRKAESANRAKRNEVETSNRKFSGTLEGLGDYRKTIKKPKSINITNATEEQTLGCISGKETLLISPILEWTDEEVWEFLGVIGVSHCEVYDKGIKRVGCLYCPMSRPWQKKIEAKVYPHIRRNWINTIKAIREAKAKEGELSGMWKAVPDWETDPDKIATNICDWWISEINYHDWYTKRFSNLNLFDI